MTVLSFYPEEIVRSFPHSTGSYTVYRIVDCDESFAECLKVGSACDPDCERRYPFHLPYRLPFDQLELYSFEGRKGTYRIGDKVKAFGLSGEHEVLHFMKQRRSGETNAVLKPPFGSLVSRIAYFVEKL